MMPRRSENASKVTGKLFGILSNVTKDVRSRVWAKAGVMLGSIVLVVLPTLIILNLDRLREFIDVLSKLGGGR